DTSEAALTIVIKGDQPVTITPKDPEPGDDNNTADVSGGKLVVFDSGLKGGSQEGQAATATKGEFDIDAPDGVASIVVTDAAGNSIDLIVNGSFKPQTIETAEGKLNFTGFDASTGKLTYEFVLENAGQHPANDQLSHNFTVTVTDKDGDAASSNITVEIRDDAPEARDDFASVEKGENGEFALVAGDLLANDAFGADGKNAGQYVELVGNGKSEYGDLTLNADGTYSFRVNPENAEIAALKNGEEKIVEYKYQITDKDGDTSEAALTIVIKGDQPVTITPKDPEPGNDNNSVDAGGGKLVVFDSGLKGGSQEGQAATATKGEFDIDAPDGLATIVVTDAAGNSLNVFQNGVFTAHTFQTTEGKLNITGFDPATGKLTYEFVLENAGEHPANDQLSHQFTVTATDKDGDKASGNITVEIRDDNPLANNDYNSVTEHEAAQGNVLANDVYGADGSATFADGVSVKWILPASAERVEDSEGVPCYKVELPEGEALLYDNGYYTFTPNGTGEDTVVRFDYEIIDADGDTSRATLTIDIANIGPSIGEPGMEISHATVDEAKLEFGSGEGEGTASVINTFAINTHGEGGTLSFTLNGATISFAVDATDTYHGDPLTITTPQGTFTVNSIVNGVAEYTYTLTTTDLEPSEGNDGRDIHGQAQKIQVELVDNFGGDKTNGVINVNIVDDVPVVDEAIDFGDVKETEDGKRYVNDDAEEISGQLTNLVFGADSDGATVEFKITVTTNGEEKILVYKGDVKGTGDDITIDFGEAPVTLDDKGNFVFTRPDGVDDGESDKYAINVTVTDKDGDQTQASGAIYTNVEPGIVPTPDPKDPDPDPDPDGPSIEKGDLISEVTVDEAGLANGSHSGDGSDEVTHKFAINTHGEGGTLSFTLNDATISFAVDTSDTYHGEPMTIETTQGIFTVSSIVGGVVEYTYTLKSTDENATEEQYGDNERGQNDESQVINVTLVDNFGGDETNGVINVNIIDDVPVVDEAIDFGDVNKTEDGKRYVNDDAEEISGQLTNLVFGADSDGATVEFKITVTTNGEEKILVYKGDVKGTGDDITIDFGEAPVTLDDKGNFVFTRPDGVDDGESDKYAINVTVTDKDGDQTQASGAIYTNVEPGIVPTPDPKDPDPDPDPDGPSIEKGDLISEVTVDEAGLANGSHSGDGSDEVTHKFAINTHGEGGKLTFSVGENSITLRVDENDNLISDELKDGDLTLTTDQGIFTVNSIVGGVVEYTYTLKSPDENADEDQYGDNKRGQNNESQVINVTLVDNFGGDDTYGVINVNIIDDVPEVEGLGVSSDQLIANNIIGDDTIFFDDRAETIQGVINGLNLGADRDGATLKLALVDQNGDEIEGQYRLYDVSIVDDNIILKPQDGGNQDIVLKYDEETSAFTFTYERPDEHIGGKGDKEEHSETYNFKLTVTDNDGDEASASAVIVSNYRPDFTPPPSTEDPDPDPVPQPDPGDPAASVTEIKVYESALKGGSGKDETNAEPNAEQKGYFSIDTHHEGGTLLLSWGGNEISVELDESNSWKGGDGLPKSLSFQNGTFTVDSIENGQVNYKFVLDKALQDGDAGIKNDEVSRDPIEMTLTDTRNNDVAYANIKVTVVDDAPIWTSVTYDDARDPVLASIDGKATTIDFTGGDIGGGADQFAQHGLTSTLFQQDSWGINSTPTGATVKASTAHGHVDVYATTVHYKYVESDGSGLLNVDHVVDITTGIKHTARALYLTGEGITVGSAQSAHAGAWNGGNTPGEISVSIADKTQYLGSNNQAVKNFENAYGSDQSRELDADNVSEAVNFNVNGFIAYGFEIDLGGMDAGDRVLVTFMMTPEHSSDDVIVKTEVLDTAGKHQIAVPDGFTKVFVSALPKGDQTVENGGFGVSGEVESSGFIIKAVDFLAPSYKSSGQVIAASADGVAYDWNWSDLKTDDKVADVLVKGQNGGEYDIAMVDNGVLQTSGEYEGMLKYSFKVGVGADGKAGALTGQQLFDAYIDQATGKWAVVHHKEFEMLHGERPFQITATDGDHDTANTILNVKPQFMRFAEVMDGHYNKDWNETDVASKDHSDDILVGTDDNTLMYGKGGDDMLIGDKYAGGAVDSADAAVNQIAGQVIKAVTMEDLNKVDANGNSTVGGNTTVDNLYNQISGLNATQKGLLGQQLESHEKDYSGHDALYGGAGNDLLFGGAGNDYLSGDAGADIIYAGGGHDIIVYDAADKFVDGGSGIDVMIGGQGTPSLQSLLASGKVQNVEMLLTSENKFISTMGINSPDNLTEKGVNINGNTVELSDAWTLSKTENGVRFYENANGGNKLTLQIKEGANVGKAGETLVIDDAISRAALDQSGASKSRMAMAEAAAAEIGLFTALATAGNVDAAPRNAGGNADDSLAPQARDLNGLDPSSPAVDLTGRDAINDAEDMPFMAESDGQQATASLMDPVEEGSLFMADNSELAENGMSRTSGADDAGKTDNAAMASRSVVMEGSEDNSGEYMAGTDAAETIFGTDGDDIIDGLGGADSIFAGAGNDIIIYDSSDYLIDGGEGIDFLIADSGADTLDQLLKNGQEENADGTMVRDVEVMIKGIDYTNLQSMDELASKYGFSFGKDANGNETLILDGGKWEAMESPDGASTTTFGFKGDDSVTLETSLELTPQTDQTSVITLVMQNGDHQ
ncbi:MAG: VCBS domain-containing protein, partial [Desulfovibrio sp.]|nr:VCBS domain-containing protein [Desulfovibrio sp.]